MAIPSSVRWPCAALRVGEQKVCRFLLSVNNQQVGAFIDERRKYVVSTMRQIFAERALGRPVAELKGDFEWCITALTAPPDLGHAPQIRGLCPTGVYQ
jgi:hypothetical protein